MVPIRKIRRRLHWLGLVVSLLVGTATATWTRFENQGRDNLAWLDDVLRSRLNRDRAVEKDPAAYRRRVDRWQRELDALGPSLPSDATMVRASIRAACPDLTVGDGPTDALAAAAFVVSGTGGAAQALDGLEQIRSLDSMLLVERVVIGKRAWSATLGFRGAFWWDWDPADPLGLVHDPIPHASQYGIRCIDEISCGLAGMEEEIARSEQRIGEDPHREEALHASLLRVESEVLRLQSAVPALRIAFGDDGPFQVGEVTRFNEQLRIRGTYGAGGTIDDLDARFFAVQSDAIGAVVLAGDSASWSSLAAR